MYGWHSLVLDCIPSLFIHTCRLISMGNPPRRQKRVFAECRRAPDGSAFQKCDGCGVLVAVALADMHACEVKSKRSKVHHQDTQICETNNVEPPRSPYHFFKEKFAKTCEGDNLVDIDRKGFETWKNMSTEERMPYIRQADRVDAAYSLALLRESNLTGHVDDEADSILGTNPSKWQWDPSDEFYNYYNEEDENIF